LNSETLITQLFSLPLQTTTYGRKFTHARHLYLYSRTCNAYDGRI